MGTPAEILAEKPTVKPQNPCFSSGPCAKRPGWSLAGLDGFTPGRSHRAGSEKAKLKEVIEKHRALLGIPAEYKIGIVPASDTGAMEMAMWSMLGQRPVDVFAWESFTSDWLKDITQQLKLEANTYEAPYGQLPDLSKANPANDIVFAWNGTTAGVRVPNGDWISDTREGLTICDATSAVFAYDMPWDKLDITTWSWQKCLGSEAAHGMLVLSPRAVERLETYTPPRGLPKIFRMTKGGKLNEGIFEGATINTPSMLAVEDCLDALNWVESIGGVKATIARTQQSFEHIAAYVEKTDWLEFLCEAPEARSITSVQMKLTADWFTALPMNAPADNPSAPNAPAQPTSPSQWSTVSALCQVLEREGVAYDIKAHRNSLPGIRIWCGATVEPRDVAALLPWLDYAYSQITEMYAQKAA